MTARRTRQHPVGSSSCSRTKRYPCTIPGCEKSFTRLSHLRRHALNHSETQWVCARCNAPFKRLDLLERHKARHSIKDRLAGGMGLGILQTRRKTISGSPFESAAGERTREDLVLGDRDDDETAIVPRTGNEHAGQTIPNCPVDDSHAMTAATPSLSLFELGNMYYDTGFDSAHFDVMGLTCSPPGVRCLESPIQDVVEQAADEAVQGLLPGTSSQPSRLQLPSAKRDEILDLLTEIRPVYPNGSLIDGKNGDLSEPSMQEYVDLFIRYFNTSYPLIHIPTLDIMAAEPILLLSMVILGATYKHKEAHQLSVCLYDALVPYILSGLMSIPIPDLSTLQGFLILECYGMYRAGPYQREKAMLIHTLLFDAIRRVSRYHVRGGIMLPSHLQHPQTWDDFVYAEEYKRLIFFVFMWDTQNVSLYSFMPSMSTHTIQVQLPCAQEIWTATTPTAWEQAMQTHPEDPPNFDSTVKSLVEDGDRFHPHRPLDGLSLTLLLHGIMSMCNDMVHFDNRSIYLGDLESKGSGSVSWTPWRRRMTHALEVWKVQYDAYNMSVAQSTLFDDETCPSGHEHAHAHSTYQKERTALLALYHTAHIVINCEIRHLQNAAGMKAIFGHIVTPADCEESSTWVRSWVRGHCEAADHAAWHAAQMFREGLLHLKSWDANDVLHYPWCLVTGTLTCWAFHHFGGERQTVACSHGQITRMAQGEWRMLMNHCVSLMASMPPTAIRRALGKCCVHGLAVEISRYLKRVRWTAAFEAMKLLEALSVAGC
ncbi:fungal-specific transcription factor domain-containing protein [Aspergillus varians]